MVLKQQWVPGSHYWESAVRLFDRIFQKDLEKKMQQWLDRYFGK